MKFIISSVLFLFSTLILNAQVPGANREPDYDYEIDEAYPEMDGREEIMMEVESVDSRNDYYRSNRNSQKYFNWTYYYENGKKGLMVNGVKITAAIYTVVVAKAPYGFIVRQGIKNGFIDSTGQSILEVEYDFIEPFFDEFLNVKKGDEVSLYHITGKRLIKPKYKSILGVNKAHQVAVEDKKGNYHLLSTEGKRILKNAEYIGLYSNGAIVAKDKKYAFFGSEKKSEFEYDQLLPSTSSESRYSGYGRAYEGGISIDKKRKILVKVYYDFLRQDLDYLMAVKENLEGIIDTNLQVVVPIVHGNIRYNSYPKYFELQKGGFKGIYISNIGRYIEPKYSTIQRSTSSSLEVVVKGQHGIVNLNTGEEIIAPLYDDIRGVYFGYIITDNRLKGLIDTSGNVLLKPEYDQINDLGGRRALNNQELLFSISKDNKFGVFSPEKGILIPLLYSKVSSLKNQFIMVEESGKYGLFNLEGEPILKPEYDNIEPASKQYDVQVYMAMKGKNILLIDSSGQRLLEEDIIGFKLALNENYEREYEDAKGYNIRKILVLASGKTGVLSLNKKKICIPAVYDDIIQEVRNYRLKKEIYLVKQNGKYGIIDEDNTLLVPIVYDSIQLF